jgi:hypothetical protein
MNNSAPSPIAILSVQAESRREEFELLVNYDRKRIEDHLSTEKRLTMIFADVFVSRVSRCHPRLLH